MINNFHVSNIISIERMEIKGIINYRNGILKFHLGKFLFFLPTLMEQNFNANASVSIVFRHELSRITREKKEKITMEFPSLCPRPNNEKQSYWTSDYALTLLNRYYASCDCGGQHGCEWNYAWNANAICWIFSHDSRENSLRLLDKSLRETRDDDFSMLIDDECCSVRRVILVIFFIVLNSLSFFSLRFTS